MERGGQEVRIKIGGTPVNFTDESMTSTDSRVYAIVDKTKQIWDYNSPVSIKVDNSPVAEDFLLDMTKGTIIFSVAKARTVTVSGKYVNTTTTAYAHKYSLSTKIELYDATRFGDSYKRKCAGEKYAEGKISDFDVIDSFYTSALESGKAVLLEFYKYEADPNPKRIWALVESEELSSAVGSIQDKDVSFNSTGIF